MAMSSLFRLFGFTPAVSLLTHFTSSQLSVLDRSMGDDLPWWQAVRESLMQDASPTFLRSLSIKKRKKVKKIKENRPPRVSAGLAHPLAGGSTWIPSPASLKWVKAVTMNGTHVEHRRLQDEQSGKYALGIRPSVVPPSELTSYTTMGRGVPDFAT